MARNANVALTDLEAATVATYSPFIFTANEADESVTVRFLKRDNSESIATGTILSVLGQDSTLAIVLDTIAEKGRPTSVNVGRIIDMTGSVQA